MASTPKAKRKWVKDEKRIIKLMYRKGLLQRFSDITSLYWAEYRHTSKRHKYGKYRFYVYYPEIHYSTVDYWGECDEHSVVSGLIESLYWGGYAEPEFDEKGNKVKDEYFKNPVMKRAELIKYLQSLPTVKKDSKINRILNQSNV